jgi:DnaJ like chaperone protein
MEATICLSIYMLFKDKIDFPKKIIYIKKYFYKKFPSSIKHFPNSFSHSLKNRVTIESVCFWLNKKLDNKQDRINILYFLAGISMIDGSISNSEKSLLIEIQELLHLDSKDLDAIIAMYTRYEETKEEQRFNSIKTNTDRRDQARIVIYCTVLEISEKSTFEEIKKAYRKLAMLNHPDKYEKAGKDMMNLANERFLKIQEAYEFLERMNKLKKIN